MGVLWMDGCQNVRTNSILLVTNMRLSSSVAIGRKDGSGQTWRDNVGLVWCCHSAAATQEQAIIHKRKSTSQWNHGMGMEKSSQYLLAM